MDFKPSITPVDVIKKGAFGVSYFRDIYSNRQINRWKKIISRFVGIFKKN